MTQETKFIFPKPTGTYNVGTKSLHLTDKSRKETKNLEPNLFRELMVQAWYPTEESRSEQNQENLNPYAPDYLINSLKDIFKSFPDVTKEDLSELDSIRTHAISNSTISEDGPFPLVLVSHGYYSSRFYYTAICEELASNGYIVLAIDHTYDAGITQFPDGRTVPFKLITNADQESDEFYNHFHTRLEIRVNDIRFVLNQIPTTFLANKVDMNKVGAFGSSLGGEAVIQAALQDSRIKAIASMDGFPAGPALPDSLSKPLMIFLAEKTNWSDLKCSDNKKKEFTNQTKAYEKLCNYKVVMKDADHVIFSDFALFNHLDLFKKIPATYSHFKIGQEDGFKAMEIICAYLKAFFDKYLRDIKSDLLESKKMIDENKKSKWISDIIKSIPLETSGLLKTKDKQNNDVILDWRLTHVKDPTFSKYMRDLRDIGVQSFVPVEVAFLKSNLDKEFQEAYCKPFEPLFEKSKKANDWHMFKKALDRADWNIVEDKMRLIIEEIFLMDYSNFGTNDLHLFVITKDKNTNKIQGYAMFYITPEYPYSKLKMTHIGVIPEKRGLGIAKILMSSVLKIIPSTKLIFQGARPTNENAIKAYTACGFTVDKNPVLEPHLHLNPDHFLHLEYKTDESSKLQKVAETLQTIN